jgi:CBS domain-containing protein
MTSVTIGREEPLARAWRPMQGRCIRHLPVVDADQILVGVVSDDDVREALERARVRDVESRPPALVVGEVMARVVVTVSPACDLVEAARLMRARKTCALPVVEAGRVIGIRCDADVFAAFVESIRR